MVAETILDNLPNVSFRDQIENPSSTIMELAEEENAHYTVIRGCMRTPTGKAIFGSATQLVLLESDRPVVTVISE